METTGLVDKRSCEGCGRSSSSLRRLPHLLLRLNYSIVCTIALGIICSESPMSIKTICPIASFSSIAFRVFVYMAVSTVSKCNPAFESKNVYHCITTVTFAHRREMNGMDTATLLRLQSILQIDRIISRRPGIHILIHTGSATCCIGWLVTFLR